MRERERERQRKRQGERERERQRKRQRKRKRQPQQVDAPARCGVEANAACRGRGFEHAPRPQFSGRAISGLFFVSSAAAAAPSRSTDSRPRVTTVTAIASARAIQRLSRPSTPHP